MFMFLLEAIVSVSGCWWSVGIGVGIGDLCWKIEWGWLEWMDCVEWEQNRMDWIEEVDDGDKQQEERQEGVKRALYTIQKARAP